MKNCNKWLGLIMGLALAGAVPAVVRAGVKTWLPISGTNVWAVDGNWSGGTMPVAGDDVVITNPNVSVVISAGTPASGWLNSVLVGNAASLVFSNWNSALSATNITVDSQGTVTLPKEFINSATKNNIYLVCANLLVKSGGTINADYKGYACGNDIPGGAIGSGQKGDGPGGGPTDGWTGQGASYGGQGGGMTRTPTFAASTNYGSASMPFDPGSGGGGGGYGGSPLGLGGRGGGAVRIEATGSVTVNGTITAKGEACTSQGGGGGSGGSIYIACNTFAGNNGVVRADGGGAEGASGGGGNGGGGRIAVVYNPSSQSNQAAPSVVFSALPGMSTVATSTMLGDAGTLYFPDASLFSILITNVQGHVYGVTSWSPDSLTMSNVWVGFNEEGFQLTVTNGLQLIGPSCKMELGGSVFTNTSWSNPQDLRLLRYSGTQPSVLNVGGSLTLTNSAKFYVYGAQTNGVAPTYGALVSVTGDVVITTNCWIYPYSHPTNGGSALFRMSNLTIAASISTKDAGINADTKGYRAGAPATVGSGPGAGKNTTSSGATGGGYGGRGGKVGGMPYGVANAPTDPGSGGGGTYYYAAGSLGQGGAGGGLVRIEAAGTVSVNGLISANGEDGSVTSVGGGSGGGVYIVCRNLSGDFGAITVNGGKGDASFAACGGGAGGRIAVIYTNAVDQTSLPGLTFAAGYGLGGAAPYNGELGTIYFPDMRLLAETMSHTGVWLLPAYATWSPNSLTVSNGCLRFNAEGFRLNVTNDVVISGPSGRLELGGNTSTNLLQWILFPYSEMSNGPAMNVGGRLVLTNGGSLMVCAARTNGAPASYGALVSVTGDVYIASNCWVTPVSHPTNGGSVFFHMNTLTVAATPGATNAGFNADGRGYRGGTNLGAAFGPGGGIFMDNGTPGGGYGGFGGRCGGKPYGNVAAPIMPGSGGGGTDYSPSGNLQERGGAGGGVVWIEAPGGVTLNGLITANGLAGESRRGGGGSGGAVYITCNQLAGQYGVVFANGGLSETDAGGGGGGRIAVIYTPASQTTIPGITFSAMPGRSASASPLNDGDLGTLYFPDGKFLTETLPHSGQWANPSFTSWAPNSLTVSNAWIRFPVSGFSLNVSNNVNIFGASARLDLGGNAVTNVYMLQYAPYSDLSAGPSLTVGGDLTVSNSARLQVFSAPTNAAAPKYGALVRVTGTMLLRSNAWVYPVSNPTNGGSPVFRVGNLTIADTNCGISADSGGFLGGPLGFGGWGTGRGGYVAYAGCGGGGYGGRGGGAYLPGITYGSSNAPADPGSGGSGPDWNGSGTVALFCVGRGGKGGGLVRIEAPNGMVTLNGTITANGRAGDGSGARGGAGGSGGGVYIVCRTFKGSATGQIRATGGNGDSGAAYSCGGGGGGRIAIWRVSDLSSGSIATNVNGGVSYVGAITNGAVGTVVWGLLPAPGTAVFLR